jgi:hypothetical protein
VLRVAHHAIAALIPSDLINFSGYVERCRPLPRSLVFLDHPKASPLDPAKPPCHQALRKFFASGGRHDSSATLMAPLRHFSNYRCLTAINRPTARDGLVLDDADAVDHRLRGDRPRSLSACLIRSGSLPSSSPFEALHDLARSRPNLSRRRIGSNQPEYALDRGKARRTIEFVRKAGGVPAGAGHGWISVGWDAPIATPSA